MAKVYEELDDRLSDWIRAQPMYFNATAPLAADGHINLSPRGLDTFRILNTTQVAYLDLTGSGNESAAHISENGRITLMFCAFEGDPRILRLFGRGEVILPNHEDWDALIAQFPQLPGIRQIVRVNISRVQTSCGFGVPLMDYRGQRDTLLKWAEKKGDDGIARYWEDQNSTSIDGLKSPDLRAGHKR